MLNVRSDLQATTLITLKPGVSRNALYNKTSAQDEYQDSENESNTRNYFKLIILKKW